MTPVDSRWAGRRRPANERVQPSDVDPDVQCRRARVRSTKSLAGVPRARLHIDHLGESIMGSAPRACRLPKSSTLEFRSDPPAHSINKLFWFGGTRPDRSGRHLRILSRRLARRLPRRAHVLERIADRLRADLAHGWRNSGVDILSGAPIWMVGVRRVGSMCSRLSGLAAIDRRRCDTY